MYISVRTTHLTSDIRQKYSLESSTVIQCVHIQNECDYIQKGFECADTRNECDHIRKAPGNSPVEGR